MQNRAHFFGAAAEAMRRILNERARRKSRQRRGGSSLQRFAGFDGQLSVLGAAKEAATGAGLRRSLLTRM
jgi:hypothetical protein